MSLISKLRPLHLVNQWLNRFEETCRSRKIRLTAQRRAVFEALAADPAHPTVEEIYLRLKKNWPSLPLPTVYRIAEDLIDLGLIRRVASENGPLRLDANMEPHQHLVCRVCGSMEDWRDSRWDALPLPSLLSGGFVAEEYEVRVSGLCRSCADKKQKVGRFKSCQGEKQ